MKRNNLPWIILISTLLLSISCSLFSGLPKSDQTPSLTDAPASTSEQPSVGSDQTTSATESVPDSYVTAITAGGTHACALFNTGKVKCWGSNSEGQLGDGSFKPHNTPAEVPGLENVTAISAGGSHTCALLASGEVKCFGANLYGQLGDGTKERRKTPTLVSGLTDAVSIAAGDEHTCAITKENKAKCWGKNLYFRIGSGTGDRIFTTPVEVAGLAGVPLSIAPGYEHTCALIEGGEVQCWGHNDSGQVGVENTSKIAKVPSDVTGLQNGATSVSTGFSTSCAVTPENSIVCWGWIGMLDFFTSPQELDEMRTNMTAATVGGGHICGLTNGGKVKCLGENDYGQLGDGATEAVYYAKKVDGLQDIQSIHAGLNYTCALANNSSVFCWGQNTSGQLGNGTNTDTSTPVEVTGLAN